MAFKFNPFTGTLDQTGSGGGASYIDGEVQNFSALPETIGTPAVDSAYLVREAEGTWLLARKPAGIYIRTADTGVRAADWTHAGAFPDVFNDANFLLYDNSDSTKNLAFQLSGITTGTTRTLTAPDASGTIALTSDFASPPAIGNTTPNTAAFTTLTASSLVASGNVVSDSNLRMRSNTGQISLGAANDVQLFRGNTASVLELRSGTSPQTFRIYNTYTDASNYERGFMRWTSNVLQIGTEKAGTGSARSVEFHYDGTAAFRVFPQGINVRAAGMLGFASNGITGVDVALDRPSASVIRIGDNSTNNPPALRIHNQLGSTEYAALRWASNEFIFDANAGSGTLRGIKLGSASTSLLGFFGATPVVQQAAVADATDAATAITQLNDLLAAMRTLGLIAT
jgi:hypothetical protein